jgi:prepilin-type N-terminal cleavage/methylation domain-containing protein
MKKAFTLLELVMVIIVIGIVSVSVTPSFQRSTVKEAANQLLSDIRYTQHLALSDNKFNGSDINWYKARWQLQFGRSNSTDQEWAYSIYSDGSTYTGNPDITEMAKNPLNPNQLLSGGYSGTLDWDDQRATAEMNLGKKYGILNTNTGVVFTGGCLLPGSPKRLSFDYLGRPLRGNLSSLDTKYLDGTTNRIIQSDCFITISNGSDSETIVITPETGYAYIQ